MENKSAAVISRLFNPLVITTYYLIVALNLQFHFATAIPLKARWLILGMTLITTFIIPGLLINVFEMFLKKKQPIEGRDKKIAPLIIASIFYFLTYYLFNQVNLSPIFSLFILGATSLLVITLLVTLTWNISVYMIATGALFGAFLGLEIILEIDVLALILFSLLMAGFTGYARLKNGDHKPAQIYIGFLLGAVVMLLHYLYF